MKRILTGIFIAAVLSAPALAADMAPAYKAPIYAPVDPWIGFYVGGSIGARRSDVKWTTLDFDTAAATNVDNPAHLNDTSIRVGTYAGYNWLFAPAALVGLEADIAWANNKKTRGGFPGASGVGGSDPAVELISAKLGWDGSIRARLGYLITPNWLAYASGGIAWQQIKTDSICTLSITSFCGNGTFAGSSSTTKTGWTAGGGVETILTAHWIGRIEYRYADFGHVANRLPPAPNAGFHAEVDVRTHTALVGVAYKF